jgi:tetratricopeptide (TPR) repeat protein
MSTTTVACPYCGRELVQDARFCDGCGKDLSLFWKTLAPLIVRLSQQQTSLNEQSRAAVALNDRIQTLELEIDAGTKAREEVTRLTQRVHDLEAKLTEAVPRTELEAKVSEVEYLKRERNKQTEMVQGLEAKLARSVQRTQLEAVQSENNSLKEDKAELKTRVAELSEVVRKLEGRLAETVPKGELETKQSDLESVQSELSKLRSDKAQLETSVSSLTSKVHELQARLSRTVPRTEIETRQFEIENLRNELSKLRDKKEELEASIGKLSDGLAKAHRNLPEKRVYSNTLLLADKEASYDSKREPRSSAKVLSNVSHRLEWLGKYVEVNLQNLASRALHRMVHEVQSQLEQLQATRASSQEALALPKIEEVSAPTQVAGEPLRKVAEGPSPVPTAKPISFAPMNEAQEWTRKGNTQCESGRYDEGIACYDKAIQIDPNDTLAWYEKGRVFYTLSRYDEANECYDMLLKIDPESISDFPWYGEGEKLKEKTLAGTAVGALKTEQPERKMTTSGQTMDVPPITQVGMREKQNKTAEVENKKLRKSLLSGVFAAMSLLWWGLFFYQLISGIWTFWFVLLILGIVFALTAIALGIYWRWVTPRETELRET